MILRTCTCIVSRLSGIDEAAKYNETSNPIPYDIKEDGLIKDEASAKH